MTKARGGSTLSVVKALAGLFFAIVLVAQPTAKPAGDRPKPPGELLDVGSDRKLHVWCQGKGEPTVLLLNGLPRYSFHFILVQPEIAKFTRVCTHDRAGDAWSDPWPAGYSVDTMLDDLDRVRAQIRAERVVLAGHSFGGVLARAYQQRFPKRVASLVLIDSPHHDWLKLQVAGQPKRLSEMTQAEVANVVAESKARFVAPKGEPQMGPPFDKLPDAWKPVHLWAMKRMMEAARPSDIALALDAQWRLYSGLKQAKFGSLPMTVITRPGPDAWVASQRELAALSQAGNLVVASQSGHDVELDQPAVVVDAVRAILNRR